MHPSAFAGAIARPARWLALSLVVVSAACGDDGEAIPDPCRDVVCLVGQDCVDGICVDRPGTGGSGGGGSGGAGRCATAADCAFDPAGPFCDTGRGTCVACLEEAHCGEGKSCRDGVCHGGCEGDADCSGETPWCRLLAGTCVACLGPEHCGEGEICRGDACVPETIACTVDAECSIDPTRSRCRIDGESGICVECLGAEDCGAEEGCVENACVSIACASDAECSAISGLPRCHLESSRCVACLADDDCAGGESCIDQTCVIEPRCTSDADCTDSHAPACDEVSGDCLPCADDGDCSDPAAPRCAPTGACLACLADDHCGGDTPRCGPAGTCVGCLSSGDCAASERCEESVCIRSAVCVGDEACAAGFVCDRGACVACRTDAECPRGTCVAGTCADRDPCAGDADCATGLCAGGACVACAIDLDCRPGLWCDAGACLEAGPCVSDHECAAGRVCVDGACAAATCADDRNEPDGGPDRARPYAPGLPVSGVLCPNDEDWLVLAAGEGAGLDVRLIAPPDGATMALVWYDAGGARHERSAYEDRLAVRNLPPAAVASRYFLRIRSGGVGGGYTVLATVEPDGGACADPLEPNDTLASARAVLPNVMVEGLTLCGDEDFYRVDVPSGRTLSAYAFFTGGGLQLETFTVAGSRLDAGVATPYLGGGRMATAGPASAGGITYLVRARASGTAPASYALFLAIADDPACLPAPALIARGQDRGRATGATLGHAADRGTACGAGGPDASYLVQLEEEAGLSAVVRAGHDARLFLVDAVCEENLSCAPAAGGAPALDVAQLPRGDYVLVVGGYPSAAGPYEVAARVVPPADPPANDLCATPLLLDLASGSARVTGSTRGAGADHEPACAGPSPDVFYRFGLPTPSRVVLDLVSDRPVWLGLADASCAAAGTCSSAATVHHLDLELSAGNHLLVVGSATGASASFELSATVPPTFANERCANAAVLDVPGIAHGDTTWARNDLDWPLTTSCTGYYTGGGELFHQVSLDAGQTITAILTPAGWDGALYLIADCVAPACLAGADKAFTGGIETLLFTAPTAGLYHLVVDGAGAGGPYALEVK